MSTLVASNLQASGGAGTAAILASVNGAALAGMRNAIINGGFDIWQRGTSFTPVSNDYTADRWAVVYDGSGATRAITQQGFVTGSTEAQPSAESYLSYNQSVAGTAGTFNTLAQRIENVRTFQNQTVTLSFYARGLSASLTLPFIQLRQIFGGGGSARVDTTLASNVVIASGTFTRYTYTVTLPSISGKTIGTNHYLEAIIFLPINTTFNFNISGVQLEAGTVATPFERRSAGQELALCQRYFYGYNYTSNSAVYADVSGRALPNVSVLFPVTMRTSPTVVISNGSGINVTVGSVSAISTGFTQTATATAAGYSSYSWTLTSASAEL